MEREREPWGYSAAIDIHGCDLSIIKSKEAIQEYVIRLCKVIDMVRYGDCQIEHFGSGNKEGYTLVQLIETSCITAHFANDTSAAYIDVFSCKLFNANLVSEFSRDYFGGQSVTLQILTRY